MTSDVGTLSRSCCGTFLLFIARILSRLIQTLSRLFHNALLTKHRQFYDAASETEPKYDLLDLCSTSHKRKVHSNKISMLSLLAQPKHRILSVEQTSNSFDANLVVRKSVPIIEQFHEAVEGREDIGETFSEIFILKLVKEVKETNKAVLWIISYSA